MAASKDEILDAIAKMSLMDVVELIADMEKKFGVTAAAAPPPAPPPAATATGAAAVTPNFFSMSAISSTTSMRLILAIASRISSFETAMLSLIHI